MQAHHHRSSRRFLLEGLEGAALLTGALATWPVSKRWLRDWGSEEGERQRSWPGDRLVSSNPEPYTRGIDIAAPAPIVWQWVVQFGLGRAGFYSSEATEEHSGRSWSFYIQPIDDDSSRLIVRSCIEPAATLAGRIAMAVEGPIDFVMEQRMLRTIKRLAEGTARPS